MNSAKPKKKNDFIQDIPLDNEHDYILVEFDPSSLTFQRLDILEHGNKTVGIAFFLTHHPMSAPNRIDLSKDIKAVVLQKMLNGGIRKLKETDFGTQFKGLLKTDQLCY